MASYLLPVRPNGSLSDASARNPSADRKLESGGDSPLWFWLHLYVDRALRQERVVLTYRRDRAARPLVRVLRESLLERFPPSQGPQKTLHWGKVAAEIVDHGAGCASFLPLELGTDSTQQRADPKPDAAATLLLDHHLDLFARS